MLLVFGLVWAMGSTHGVGAAPCSPQNVSLTITDKDGVLDLASALECSDGNFMVIWVGNITLSQTLAVTDGSSLTIDGESSDSTVDGMGNTGPLIFVEGASSKLTLRNLSIARGSGHDGGGVYASTSATVKVVNCIFSGNNAGDDGGGISIRTRAKW